MNFEEAMQRQQAMGLGEDRSSAEAVASGRMTPEEYEHRQQRRAAPSAGSDGMSVTQAAKGWDGKTNANSAVTDESGNKMNTSGALMPYVGDTAGTKPMAGMTPISSWMPFAGQITGQTPPWSPGVGPIPGNQSSTGGGWTPFRPPVSATQPPQAPGGGSYIDQILGNLLRR